MTVMLWLLVGYFILAALVMPTMVGKTRRPMTQGEGLFTSVFAITVAITLAWAGVQL